MSCNSDTGSEALARKQKTKRYGLPRSERMHGKTKIQMLFAKGKRFSCGRLTIVYRPSPEQTAGFIASKNIGGAAKRNKAKRLLREAYRMNKGNFKGLSMIFYAQGTLQSDEVLNAFERFARVR